MSTTLKDVLGSEKHEEWVRYFVFPSPNLEKEDDDELFFRLNASCQTLIGDYIWHNEPFVLKRGVSPLSSFDDQDEQEGPSPSTAQQQHPLYFYGVTHFGDNLEDEWFIVYILRELSKLFPDVVVKIEDNDGEFLLIEAADQLPDWAESDETCKNRVYIHQGKVLLIQKELTPNCSTDGLKITQAVDIIRQTPLSITVASEGIQKIITTRIGNYPQKKIDNLHHVTIMLPPLLATILNEKPSLISVGSLAFYLRDPISLKATRLMKMFKPGDGLVKSRVKFTKCLYAMLMKQDFRPDKRSGWPLTNPGSSEYKASSLGAKLTTGFEIILEQTHSNNASSSLDESPSSFDTDSSWLRYEKALQKTGYFKGYMEGSKPYQILLSGAKDFFKTNLKNVENSVPLIGSGSWKDNVCQEIKHLADTVKVDGDKLKKDSETLPQDDDDSWLAIKPEDLESLLEAKFQSGGLNDIPSKLKEFMKQISDFSGVEPSESGGTHQSNSPSSTGTGSPKENGAGAGAAGDMQSFAEPFDFKADEFVSAMDKLLHDLGAQDKDFLPSDDSFGSDEEEYNADIESIKKMHRFSKESREFFGIMDEMDNELATTTMGQSFKSNSNGAAATSASTSSPATSDPKTNRSSSSSSKATTTKSTRATANVEELDEFDEEEGLTPVNIDMNALANILESFQSQDGPSGPSANLLRSVGFDINSMKKKK